MRRYNPKEIEGKWQAAWEKSKIYQATEDTSKPKKYVLEYFPYPSGAAMHVGHVRNYTIGDAIARFNRMRGYNVLHPMGWDAFGLPAENYAIKNKVSPKQAIQENTARFKKQLIQLGFSYDWSREINSSDPDYYKWTQWLFLLLYKRGLAYQKEALVNWDPVDKTVLANEQVIDGRADRSGAIVEKKALKQWFFKITAYADRLLDDLDNLDWSDSIKTMQRNWIGKSKGAEVDFTIVNSKEVIRVFTTRPDTLFGATFMVLAPEHPLVTKITDKDHKTEVEDYVKKAGAKSDIERQETDREKTGVFTGAYAINPVNKEKIPVWIADYVLLGYGTGAIMAVPAHDERDWAFAKKFDLPITRVIKNDAPDEAATHEEGAMMNSGSYDDLASQDMREKVVVDLAKKGVAEEKVHYKIRDWLISRQRYWGAPIPIVHCPKDGIVPVPEDQLPVELPDITSFEPSGDGRSPLARIAAFVNTTCPKCGGPATRETDTMDGFACSSWYFLRFADPHNDKQPFSKDKAQFWLPVDDYIGGAEHAVMHLLYARFWTKVMHDEALIDFDEPFSTLRNQGMILAPDGQKMSKSKGNTIEPDGLIEQGYGADSTRIMELFIGPWNQSASWSVEGMGGSFRFLQRAWTIVQEFIDAKPKNNNEQEELLRLAHRTIERVSRDLEKLGFNTAVAALMEYVNNLYKIKAEQSFEAKNSWEFALRTLIQLLAPFAPHISEELWHDIGLESSVHISTWPVHDPKYLVENTATVVVQINGKVRDTITVPAGSDEASVHEAALTSERVKLYIDGKTIQKTIYVPGKLISFVVK